ncbi:MAG: hypothetical protein ABIR78_13130 [Ferruginibacter sp.]
MFQDITLQYFHQELNIGVQDIRNVWLMNNPPVKLPVSLHRGALSFRLPGASGKRISYATLKKGLIKKMTIIRQPLPFLPF